MTGVNLGQWRARIGRFHKKDISKNFVKGNKDYDCLHILGQLSKILCLIGKPFEILFSLSLLFSYCVMIVTLFPIFLTVYLG